MNKTRKEITNYLSSLLEEHINPKKDPRIYMSKEVTFDYGTLNQKRVDYMQFKPLNNSPSGIEKGDFYCYEIKSSIEDFKSKCGHNFYGDFNYYVMPEDVYTQVKDLIPYKIGVMVASTNSLKSIKKAIRNDRNKSLPEMLLMMFRSSNRELFKIKKDDIK